LAHGDSERSCRDRDNHNQYSDNGNHFGQLSGAVFDSEYSEWRRADSSPAFDSSGDDPPGDVRRHGLIRNEWWFERAAVRWHSSGAHFELAGSAGNRTGRAFISRRRWSQYEWRWASESCRLVAAWLGARDLAAVALAGGATS
jgi:hypothetical protein